MKQHFSDTNYIALQRNEFKNESIDIGGKTIIIGFNEPKFKKSNKKLDIGDIDSKLNARFISYFLPAVELARMQKQKPRLYIMSSINAALLWNAENEEQKKIMLANNALKMDFLHTFFEKYFENDFSLIEYVYPQDMLKIPESKILGIWNALEKKYPEKLEKIKFQFSKFVQPRQFNVSQLSELTQDQKKLLNQVDLTTAFKYAINHLFVLGDVNFDGNYIHNPQGYVSIGGEQEEFFNTIRKLSYEIVKEFGELIFDRKVFIFENYGIVLKNRYKVPPPYNGMFSGKNIKSVEVTYENTREVSFYDTQEKLQDQMKYMYENLISQEEYTAFWNNYKIQYFRLKERYRQGYEIQGEW